MGLSHKRVLMINLPYAPENLIFLTNNTHLLFFLLIKLSIKSTFLFISLMTPSDSHGYPGIGLFFKIIFKFPWKLVKYSYLLSYYVFDFNCWQLHFFFFLQLLFNNFYWLVHSDIIGRNYCYPFYLQSKCCCWVK